MLVCLADFVRTTRYKNPRGRGIQSADDIHFGAALGALIQTFVHLQVGAALAAGNICSEVCNELAWILGPPAQSLDGHTSDYAIRYCCCNSLRYAACSKNILGENEHEFWFAVTPMRMKDYAEAS